MAAELYRLAGDAPRESMGAAQDAVRTVTDIQDTATRESTLAAARLALATVMVTGTLGCTDNAPTMTDAAHRWLTALEEQPPAELAATRSAAMDRRVPARGRHPDVENLLGSGETLDGEGDAA